MRWRVQEDLRGRRRPNALHRNSLKQRMMEYDHFSRQWGRATRVCWSRRLARRDAFCIASRGRQRAAFPCSRGLRTAGLLRRQRTVAGLPEPTKRNSARSRAVVPRRHRSLGLRHNPNKCLWCVLSWHPFVPLVLTPLPANCLFVDTHICSSGQAEILGPETSAAGARRAVIPRERRANTVVGGKEATSPGGRPLWLADVARDARQRAGS